MERMVEGEDSSRRERQNGVREEAWEGRGER